MNRSEQITRNCSSLIITCYLPWSLLSYYFYVGGYCQTRFVPSSCQSRMVASKLLSSLISNSFLCPVTASLGCSLGLEKPKRFASKARIRFYLHIEYFPVYGASQSFSIFGDRPRYMYCRENKIHTFQEVAVHMLRTLEIGNRLEL